MKKILVLSAALCLLSHEASSASTHLSLSVGAPVYYEPVPVYSYHYPPSIYMPGYVEYYHRYPRYEGRGHRHDDWAYWANQERMKARKHGGHHDNGNHGNGNRGHR